MDQKKLVLWMACILWWGITSCSSIHALATLNSPSEALTRAKKQIVWHVPIEKKWIALTFDDGPDPSDTPEILDLLKLYQAKATFFVIGNRVHLYPELIQREILEGHEIANHTFSHRYMHRFSKEAVKEELLKSEQSLREVAGYHPALFRPPGGYFSRNVLEASEELGYHMIMWSKHQDTGDWNTPGVHRIVQRVLAHADSGNIILMHDFVEGKTQTVAALKLILPELQAKGYQFVTVSDLLRAQKQQELEMHKR